MKIAIPVNEKLITTEVCQSFGRAPYYVIYDTETEKSVFIDNSAAASEGGAGIKAAQLLIDNRVNVVIAPRQGENAAKVLSGAGIKSYKNISGSVTDNIDAYKNNALTDLSDVHPGYHHHGAK